jgi:hypothetical protein
VGERPESETEVGLAVLSWWLRLSPEARERYERMRREPPTTTRELPTSNYTGGVSAGHGRPDDGAEVPFLR